MKIENTAPTAPLRLLNDEGIARFRNALEEARSAQRAVRQLPTGLFDDDRYSTVAPGAMQVEKQSFATAWEAAKYLAVVLAELPAWLLEGKDGLGNPGLWSWLSVFYFGEVCSGVPGASNRYVPETTGGQANLRYYRHLLAGPYRFHRQLGLHARSALTGPLQEHNALYNALADHQDLVQNPNMAAAMNLLYTNPTTSQPLRGITSAGTPGALPRFFRVMHQLELTYDLLGISAEEILVLLPPEFDAYRARIPAIPL